MDWPCPGVEKEAECSMALQPPERDGVNQDVAQVSGNYENLKNC
jgi:hypothetical protein